MATKNLSEVPNKFRIPQQKISLMIVFGTVVIVLLGIIVVGYAIRSRPSPTVSPVTRVPSPTRQPRSTMWFDPVDTTASVGDKLAMRVIIDAKNNVINGTDAVVNYDPEYIKVISVEKADKANTAFLLFDRRSENQLQITLTKSSASATPTAQMTLVVITFQALKPGTTTLSFDYRAGSTVGSTIISARNSENILDSVGNAYLHIQ